MYINIYYIRSHHVHINLPPGGKPGGGDIFYNNYFFFRTQQTTTKASPIKYIKIRNKYNFERIKEENRNTDIYIYVYTHT